MGPAANWCGRSVLLASAAALLLAGRAHAQDAAAAAGSDTGVASAPVLTGPTDTVLPRAGIDTDQPGLRDRLLGAYGESSPAPPGVAPPSLQILPRIGLAEEYTTNAGAGLAGFGGRNVGGDFITLVQPGLTVIDTTQRLQVNLEYDPTLQVYAENSSFTQFQQQGSGDVLATLLTDWLFLDLRGSISQQSVFGGAGAAGTVSLSPNERETVSSASVSPYVAHGFGGTGTLQAGLGYIYSATDAPNLADTFPVAGASPSALDEYLRQTGAYGSSSLTTERAFANFTTGENYGRLRDRAGVDANFYSGGGALAGGRRVLFTDDASYALTRLVTLLGEVGYESLAYPNSGYGYSGVIGFGGVQLTPRRGSSLTLEYRYVDGFGSFFAQGSVQATPRIRVFGGYSEGISTFDQDQQNMLLDGGDDVTGVAASGLVAAPLISGSNFFGANQNLNRLSRLSLAASYVANYDVVTATVDRETTTPIGRPIGGYAQFSSSGSYGSISERHELTDTLSLNGFLKYGISRSGLGAEGSGNLLSVSVGLEKQYPRQLSAYIRVGGSYYVGGNAFGAAGVTGQSGDATTVIVGAVKRF